nr:SusC/RagA family TonB-linked outer membrane protein [Pedobacter sp. ASV19]
MKLITALLILGIMQVSASTFAQRITINQKNASIEAILEEIGKQSGYDVFVGVKTLQSSKPVSINVKNAGVEEVLKLCLEGQQLDFSIENKIIVIKQKQPSFIEKVVAAFDGVNVFGNVGDAENKPLPGATVTVKGTRRTTMTDNKGQFSISNVPKDAILQISFMGYINKEVKVSSDFLQIRLELSTSKLDEIQVMAYGTTNRRLSTGNITTITAKELEKQPVMNPLLALVGRVPGMTVMQTNGYEASPVKVEIRGRKTLGSSFVSDPMYIIDGVPLTNLDLGAGSNYNSGSAGVVQNGFSVTGGQSPLFNLRTSDIESIEVLKDGDATAIYGSRGANGVILITTKKGKPGASGFSVNVAQGLNYIAQRHELLNTQQYLQLRKDAFRNDNIQPDVNNAPDLMLYDTTRYTDWQKKLWGNIGKKTDVSMSLSGGDDQTQFRIGGNYSRSAEILTKSGSNQVASVSLSLGHSTADRKFKIQGNVMYSYSSINTLTTPNASGAPPNAPDIYDAVGNLNFNAWGRSSPENTYYPFANLESRYYSDTHAMTSSMLLSYQVTKNLDFSTNLGFNTTLNFNRNYNPVSSMDPMNNPLGTGFSGSSNNFNWIVEPKVNYKINLFGGEISALLGTSLQKTTTSTAGVFGLGYENDDFIESINLAPIKYNINNKGYYRYAGVFGRLSYNLHDKYIINLNGRRDGSSRFGPGNQFGNFGSIGAAWILSQENWIKNKLPSMISFLKLRGSYGLTGSDAVGDYQYLTQWGRNVGPSTALPDYNGVSPLVNLIAANPNYRWQVNKKLEVALNVGLFEDRINLETTFYRDRSGNQLTQFPTPIYTGFPNVWANWAAMVENRGLELSAEARLITTDKINWSMNFNIGRNTNILASYPDIEHSPYFNIYKVGKSINTQYLLHYTGINPLTGNYTFEDYNHDGAISLENTGPTGTGRDDRYVAIDLSPKFSGGFGTSFTYKGFNVSCFFDFTKRMGLNPYYNSQFLLGNYGNQPVEVFGNYWKAPGDHALYPKPTTIPGSESAGNFALSDGRYRDASFLRMNNLSFNYRLNEKLVKRIGAKSMSVYAQAQNIFVLSKANGMDPNIDNFSALPPAKTFLCGLSLNF